MAVAFETEVHDNLTPFAPSASLAFAVPSGLSDALLVVQLCSLDAADVDVFEYGSVTWNDATLTRIAQVPNFRSDFTDSVSVELWGLRNPAAGAGNVVATTSDGSTISRVIIQAAVLSGVDQTTGWRGAATSSGTASDASVTVTTTGTDSLVWAGYAQWNGAVPLTPGAGVTERMDEGGIGGADVSGWSGTKPAPTAGDCLMNVTGGSNGGPWVMAGFEILAAAAGATNATAAPSGVSGVGQVGAVTAGASRSVTVVPVGLRGAGAVGNVGISLDATAVLASVSGAADVGRATVFQWVEAPDVSGAWTEEDAAKATWTEITVGLGNWT